MVVLVAKLFEKHPDWVIMQPKRDTYYYRNQLVLDIKQPRYRIMCSASWYRIMTDNSGCGLLQVDCNSVITNIYSIS